MKLSPFFDHDVFCDDVYYCVLKNLIFKIHSDIYCEEPKYKSAVGDNGSSENFFKICSFLENVFAGTESLIIRSLDLWRHRIEIFSRTILERNPHQHSIDFIERWSTTYGIISYSTFYIGTYRYNMC